MTRFGFGKNWRSFLSLLNEERLHEARASIRHSLQRDGLSGCRVLDIGSGSGLFSLAAHQLGAHVVSFDYDPDSVACTRELRARFAPGTDRWEVSPGSVLDAAFMRQLGTYDVVYAWGVLHHTGDLDAALALAQERVSPGGQFVVALYNDQGWRSTLWKRIKRLYCLHPAGRWLVTAVFFPLFFAYALALDVRGKKPLGNHMRTYSANRGMSITHDWKDWLGGYPFEVARPEDVERTLAAHGFSLLRKKTTRGWGCNEFVFLRANSAAPDA